MFAILSGVVDWSNDWITAEPGFYVRDRASGAWLAGGWTDDDGWRRPMMGWDGTARRFPDRAAAERAARYLNNPPPTPKGDQPLWPGDWEVVDRTAQP